MTFKSALEFFWCKLFTFKKTNVSIFYISCFSHDISNKFEPQRVGMNYKKEWVAD